VKFVDKDNSWKFE